MPYDSHTAFVQKLNGSKGNNLFFHAKVGEMKCLTARGKEDGVKTTVTLQLTSELFGLGARNRPTGERCSSYRASENDDKSI